MAGFSVAAIDHSLDTVDTKNRVADWAKQTLEDFNLTRGDDDHDTDNIYLFDMITDVWERIPTATWWVMITTWLLIMTLIGISLDFALRTVLVLGMATYGAFMRARRAFRMNKSKVTKSKQLASTREGVMFSSKLKPTPGIQDHYRVDRREGSIGRNKSTQILAVANLHATHPNKGEVGPFPVSEKRGFIRMTLNGLDKYGLVDTGASPSCISLDIWEEMQRKSDTPLPFEDSEWVTYNFLGQKSEIVGKTLIHLSIKGESGGTVDLLSVPFLITPSFGNKAIIGQNIMKTMRVMIGYDSKEKMYLQFKNPDVRVTAVYDTQENHQLISEVEVRVPPRQTMVIDTQMAASPGKRTNLDGKPLYIYEEPDVGGVPDHIGRFNKGKVKVTVHNDKDYPLTIPPFATVARFDALDETNSSYVDAVAEFSDGRKQDRLDNCFCRFDDTVGVVLLSDHNGKTLMGYEKSWSDWEHPQVVESPNDGRWEVTQVGRNKFILHIKNPTACTNARTGEPRPTWAGKYDKIKVVFDKPELLKRSTYGYVAWLGKQYPNLGIDFEPLANEVDEGRRMHCACRSRRVSSRYTINNTRHYSRVWIHLLEDETLATGPWQSKVEGSKTNTFDIKGALVEAFPISASKFGFMVHFHKQTYSKEAVIEELLAQLKPLFPKATISVSTNAHGNSCVDVSSELLRRIFVESAKWPSYWTMFQCEKKDRPKVTVEEKREEIFGCRCGFCNPPSTPRKKGDGSLLTETKWPGEDLEKDVTSLTKSGGKAKVFVDLIGMAGPPTETAGENQESFEVVKDGMDFLDRIGEPYGYDTSWLNSKEYPIKETKGPSNWREVVNMEQIPEAAHDSVTELFDKYESVLSSSKSDYRPIKHVRLSLIPRDKTPFSMAPYPCPPHLLEHLNEIIDQMMLKGWVINGDRPTFVSSSFLVKKNAQNFRSADTAATRVPYKSSAGLTEKSNTVGGEIADPDSYFDNDTGEQQIDKQQGLKKAGQNYRLVIDYSKANEQIGHQMNCDKLITNPFGDIRFSKARRADYFSSIDLSNAFHSVCFDAQSRQYLHFHAGPGRLMASTVGSLGLAFLPSSFHAIVWACIRPSLKEHLILYVDDILVMTGGGVEEHKRVLDMLFEDLRRANLLVNVKKIKVFQKQVEYLGNMVSGEGISILPDRVKQFINLPLPKNKSQMSGLLGIVGYMQSHICNYAIRVAPLYDLLHIKNPYILTDKHVAIIRELAKEIDDAACLAHLEPRKKVYVCVDSSQYGTGGFVGQIHQGRTSVIEYFSYKTPPALVNSLSSVEFETIGLLRVIEAKPVYFHTGLTTVVCTDARSVMLLVAAAKVTQYGKLNRWVLKLISAQVSFSLKWIPNTSPFIKIADYLSRAPYDELFENHQKESWNLKETREMLNVKDKVKIPETWKGKDTITIEEIVEFVNSREHGTGAETCVSPLLEKAVGDPNPGSDDLVMCDIFANVLEDGKVPHIAAAHLCGANEIAQSAYSLKKFCVDEDDERKGGNLMFNIRDYVKAEDIFDDQRSDPKLKEIMDKLIALNANNERPKGNLRRYRMINGLLAFRKGRIVGDPADEEFKIYLPERSAFVVMALTHMFGHCSVNSIALRMKRYFYVQNFVQMSTIVVNCCRSCRLYRIPTRKNFLPGHLRKAPYFGHTLTIDEMKVPSELTTGSDTYILSIVDQFSRMMFSVVLKGKQRKGKHIAAALENVFSTIGHVRYITADQGTNLIKSKKVRDLCRLYGVQEFNMSIAHNPQSHGLVELSNKLFRQLLVKNTEALSGKKAWREVFPMTKVQMNSIPRRYCVPTENQPDAKPFVMSPHELVFGVPPDASAIELTGPGIDWEQRSKMRAATAKRLEEYYREEQRLLDAQEDKYEHPYKVGDFIMVRDIAKTEMESKGVLAKTRPKYKRKIYLITDVKKRRVTAVTIHGPQEIINEHVNKIKHYHMSEFLKYLPPEISKYYGKYYDVTRNLGRSPPSDFAEPEEIVEKRITRQEKQRLDEEKKKKKEARPHRGISFLDDGSSSSSSDDDSSDGGDDASVEGSKATSIGLGVAAEEGANQNNAAQGPALVSAAPPQTAQAPPAGNDNNWNNRLRQRPEISYDVTPRHKKRGAVDKIVKVATDSVKRATNAVKNAFGRGKRRGGRRRGRRN